MSIFESTSEVLGNENIEDLIKRITTLAGITIEGSITMDIGLNLE